jgi:hypothetical protein
MPVARVTCTAKTQTFPPPPWTTFGTDKRLTCGDMFINTARRLSSDGVSLSAGRGGLAASEHLRNASSVACLMTAETSSQTEEFRFRRRHLTLPVGLFNVSRSSEVPVELGPPVRCPSRRLRAIPKDNLLGQIDEGAQARGHVAASWIIEAISGIRGRPLA